jgi:hypothetical protein
LLTSKRCMAASDMGRTRIGSILSDGTESIIGGLNGRILNAAVINLNDNTLEDIWNYEDDGMTFDMVTDVDGEGDKEVSSFRFSVLSVYPLLYFCAFAIIVLCYHCIAIAYACPSDAHCMHIFFSCLYHCADPAHMHAPTYSFPPSTSLLTQLHSLTKPSKSAPFTPLNFLPTSASSNVRMQVAQCRFIIFKLNSQICILSLRLRCKVLYNWRGGEYFVCGGRKRGYWVSLCMHFSVVCPPSQSMGSVC